MVLKEHIEEELNRLIIDEENLTEYGKGSLFALKVIKDNIDYSNLESVFRTFIDYLKSHNTDDYSEGKLNTFRYYYEQLLVEMGYIEDSSLKYA